MAKKIILSSVVIFIIWSVIDFLIHGMALKSMYEQTAHLWRPQADIKMWMNSLVVFTHALMFVSVYVLLIRPKSMGSAIRYGLLYGIGSGVCMTGIYVFIPMPEAMALSWLATAIVQALIGGVLLGALVKGTANS